MSKIFTILKYDIKTNILKLVLILLVSLLTVWATTISDDNYEQLRYIAYVVGYLSYFLVMNTKPMISMTYIYLQNGYTHFQIIIARIILSFIMGLPIFIVATTIAINIFLTDGNALYLLMPIVIATMITLPCIGFYASIFSLAVKSSLGGAPSSVMRAKLKEMKECGIWNNNIAFANQVLVVILSLATLALLVLFFIATRVEYLNNNIIIVLIMYGLSILLIGIYTLIKIYKNVEKYDRV